MKYKFIFFVLSCSKLNEKNVYFNMQEKYNFFKKLYFDLFKEHTRFFFVEYNNDIDADLVEDGDFIYIKGIEEPNIPNTLIKRVSGIKHIHSNYEYEFIIQTNLTTIWNFSVLASLYNSLPKKKCFCGHFIFNSFISGTGILMSHDLIPLFLQIPATSYTEHDDVAISRFMLSHQMNIIRLENLEQFKMNYQILDENVNDPNSPHHKNHNLKIDDTLNTNNILYFRIKNASMELDFSVATKIIKKLYNLDLWHPCAH